MDETKITAKLPNLDLEMTLTEAADAKSETVTLRMTAVPSFEAVAGYIAHQGNAQFPNFAAPWAMNPWMALWSAQLQTWGQVAQLAWSPWLQTKTPRLTVGQDQASD